MGTRTRALIGAFLLLVCPTAFGQANSEAVAAPPPPPPPTEMRIDALGVRALAAAAGDVLVEHKFEQDNLGWIKQYDCNTDVLWDPAGFVRVRDDCFNIPPPPPGYGCIFAFWEAPGDFVAAGRGEATFGGTLSFDLRMNYQSPTLATNGFDVAIYGPLPGGVGAKWITLYSVANQLHTDWRGYNVPLDTGRTWVEWGQPNVSIAPEVVASVIKGMYRLLVRGTYQRNCEIGSGSSLDNVKVTAAGAPQASPLEMSTDRLVVEGDSGWYGSENPVTVTVTLANPGPTPIPSDFTLELGAADGLARFYIYESTLTDQSTNVTILREFHGLHSLKRYSLQRTGLTVAGGQTETLTWKVWVQPSAATTLEATLTWPGGPYAKQATIEPAGVYPVVFLHGIQGSQPPQQSMVRTRERAKSILDPFSNGYVPLLDNLVKMGYEWDKTLFAVAYDWRKSNDASANYLRRRLENYVLPASSASDIAYSANNPQNPFHRGAPKVDLVSHSNGGLVARAYIQGSRYLPDGATEGPVRKLVTIGTPHYGFQFDYRTWEGGTFKDYMAHANLALVPDDCGPIGNCEPFALWLGADYFLWPFLAVDHYGPSRAELRQYRWFTLPFIPAPRRLARQFRPWRHSVYRDGGTYYRVPHRKMLEWMHHPRRGTLTFQQLLPTEDLGTYLFDLTGGPDPYGREPNAWLEDLNRRAQGDLVDRIGGSNIQFVYGANVETETTYTVLDPRAIRWWLGNHAYRHGWPIPFAGGYGPGDGLIPEASASMAGRVPDVLRARLDATVAGDGGEHAVMHTPLVHNPRTQKEFVGQFFTGRTDPIPFHTPHELPTPAEAIGKMDSIAENFLGPVGPPLVRGFSSQVKRLEDFIDGWIE